MSSEIINIAIIEGYIKNVKMVLDKVMNLKPISVQFIEAQGKKVLVTQIVPDFPYRVINSHLYNDTFKATEYDIHDIFDQRSINAIMETLESLKTNLKQCSNPSDYMEMKEKVKTATEKNKLLYSEIVELGKTISFLKEVIDIRDKKIKGIQDSTIEVDTVLEELSKSFNYLKCFDHALPTKENLLPWLKDYVRNCEEYVRHVGNYTIVDYMNVFGIEFDDLMGVLYRCKKRYGELVDIMDALKYYCENTVGEKLTEIVETYQESKDNVTMFCNMLKRAIREKGMFMRKVGDTTEYYGITSELYLDLEKYKDLAEERLAEIKALRVKIKNFKKPMESKFKTWCDNVGQLKLRDMIEYIKKKLYRKKTLVDIFGTSCYKPGTKFCGITISYWHYKYLQRKALDPVLNWSPEKTRNTTDAKWVIKTICKLGKITKCTKAIIWARNKVAQVLGREQAGRMGRTKQDIQDTRFFNTYIFAENLTLKEFLSFPLQEKIKIFQRQYKELDREVGAHYLGRFYGVNAHRSQEEKDKTNISKVIYAAWNNEEVEKLFFNPSYTPKRNPIGHYKKMVKLVEDYCKDRIDHSTKNYLLEYAKTIIPSLSYGGDEIPKGFVKYCNKVIKKYETRNPMVAIEKRLEMKDEWVIELEKQKHTKGDPKDSDTDFSSLRELSSFDGSDEDSDYGF